MSIDIILSFLVVVLVFVVFYTLTNKTQNVDSTTPKPLVTASSYTPYIPTSRYKQIHEIDRDRYLKKYNPHDYHFKQHKYYNNDRSDEDYTDEYRGRFNNNRDYRKVEHQVDSAIRDSPRNETYTQWVNRNFDPVIPINL